MPSRSNSADGVWPAGRAHEWIDARGWRMGCNFTPSSAGSPLEMWQEATFDRETIERELGFAASVGVSSLRVFLHDLLWSHEQTGFVSRLETFLECAERRGIGVLLVLFDGVWHPHPQPGPQPEPRPHVHNSIWVQSPGARILGDPNRHAELRGYVQGVLDRFSDDPRIDGWDLFNEPDNPNPAYANDEIADKAECATALLRAAFSWAREVAPSQPLTAGVWRGSWSDPNALSEIDRLSLENSDVVSFHHYGEIGALRHRTAALRRYERPILCTEFIARGIGSTYDPHLACLRDENVGAYWWGLVDGRTQTKYPWDSWIKAYSDEPEVWHHELFRADGTPWRAEEAAFIRALTQRDG